MMPTHRPHSSSFLGSYFELYKVFPTRNYYGAYGYEAALAAAPDRAAAAAAGAVDNPRGSK